MLCGVNLSVTSSKSLEISTGDLNVIDGSLEPLLSCHIMACSQCFVTSIWTACVSVHSIGAGTASASCVCSAEIHAEFACVGTRFQRLMNVSSTVLNNVIMASRPTEMDLSSGASPSDGGRIVGCSVIGRCLWSANILHSGSVHVATEILSLASLPLFYEEHPVKYTSAGNVEWVVFVCLLIMHSQKTCLARRFS